MKEGTSSRTEGENPPVQNGSSTGNPDHEGNEGTRGTRVKNAPPSNPSGRAKRNQFMDNSSGEKSTGSRTEGENPPVQDASSTGNPDHEGNEGTRGTKVKNAPPSNPSGRAKRNQFMDNSSGERKHRLVIMLC
ncbi:hypothetical protein [Caproiciproducens faecalis]|uniref:Uncharacterized protein n=1 Tax=Caproiciproducens faecalis TaxID=2820301 RepID=A0ABS7DQI3_9FIRM|nr:hypothetical protein [Caproiciproducens faecalis]MBW7573080.1 hypothetical protein [Caproiciproducens faecalis]